MDYRDPRSSDIAARFGIVPSQIGGLFRRAVNGRLNGSAAQGYAAMAIICYEIEVRGELTIELPTPLRGPKATSSVTLTRDPQQQYPKQAEQYLERAEQVRAATTSL